EPEPDAAREGVTLLAPLIVREIGKGPERDAISPYGYPGLAHAHRVRALSRYAEQNTNSGEDGAVVEPGAVDFSGIGVVSAFVRHTLGPPPLANSTERNVVQIA